MEPFIQNSESLTKSLHDHTSSLLEVISFLCYFYNLTVSLYSRVAFLAMGNWLLTLPRHASLRVGFAKPLWHIVVVSSSPMVPNTVLTCALVIYAYFCDITSQKNVTRIATTRRAWCRFYVASRHRNHQITRPLYYGHYGTNGSP